MSRSRDNTDSKGASMKKKFKFQMENGHIYDGPFEIDVRDGIAEIEESDITPAVLLVIDAHGGQEIIEEKPKRKKSNKEKLSEDSALNLAQSTLDLLEKGNRMAGGN